MSDERKVFYSFGSMPKLAPFDTGTTREAAQEYVITRIWAYCPYATIDDIRQAQARLTQDGLLSAEEALDVLERRARSGEPLLRTVT